MMQIIKNGYKQTEIGVIPEDWEVKTLGDVLKIKHGKDQKEVQSSNGIYPILGTGGLMGFDKFLYDKESVLIGRKGTIDKPRYMNSPFWTVDTLFYSEILASNSAKFLYYKFLNIDWYSYNEASGVPSLNAKTIEKISVTIPTLSEQTAIAETLSDTDALITSIEKLIAKKRSIKQGAMQQLLQPKEGWEIKKLGEIAEFYNGKGHEQFISENGNYIVVNSKFVSTQGEIFKHSTENLFPLETNDITIVMSDIPNGKASAKCFIIPDNNKYTLNQRIGAIRTTIVDFKFLFFILNRNDYYLAFDSGTGQTNLKKNDVLDCPLCLPPNKEEQTRIATILSDMDAEITALEQKVVMFYRYTPMLFLAGMVSYLVSQI